MRRPSLKSSLVGVLSLISMLFAAFVYLSHVGSNRLYGTNLNYGDQIVPGIEVSIRLDHAFMAHSIAIATHLLAASSAEIAQQESVIAATKVEFDQAIEDYQGSIDSDAERAGLSEAILKIKNYEEILPPLLDLSRQNKNEQAADIFVHKLVPIAADISHDIEGIVASNLTEAAEAKKQAALTYDTTNTAELLAAGLMALLVFASLIFVLRAVANPIHVITRSMRKLADGNVVADVPYAGRTDEIGEMAGAVEIFRQAAISNRRLEAEAQSNLVQAEADRIRMQAEAEASARKRLLEATSGLAAGLKRLATGDLAFQLTDAFSPDFEALRHDLNSTIEQLSETLSAVAQSTSEIDSGSTEISRSAEDLSKRTEQQAAALEETAAALDEITVNVANSSKRAEEARIVAVQANTSAIESGRVVANAVDAMGKIEKSSNQVSNIIGVIDEIAFQTNLLALNAGVEAARAGEAGRGFAVVAQEVRELAQRSAKAAKEIKELIRNSSIEVQSGVKLVSETGEALKTIEGYIVSINSHMNSIATSSKEQSVGLAEVNTAVNQMDQVTQQNAAMVEETSAAGANLAVESGKLRDLVGQFQLVKTVGRPPVLREVNQSHRPVASLPRRMAGQVSRAFGGNSAVKDSWEEF